MPLLFMHNAENEMKCPKFLLLLYKQEVGFVILIKTTSMGAHSENHVLP